MTTPEPETSAGACFIQGLEGSGRRSVANTFTTAFSASCDMAAVGSGVGVGATTDPEFLLASPAGGGAGAAAKADVHSSGNRIQLQTRKRKSCVIRTVRVGLQIVGQG